MNARTLRLAGLASALALAAQAPGRAQTLVKDIYPGQIGSIQASSLPYQGAALLGRYVFGAHTSIGSQLWISDGTDAGTQLLKQVHPSGSANPRSFAAFGDQLLFVADDDVGVALWSARRSPGRRPRWSSGTRRRPPPPCSTSRSTPRRSTRAAAARSSSTRRSSCSRRRRARPAVSPSP